MKRSTDILVVKIHGEILRGEWVMNLLILFGQEFYDFPFGEPRPSITLAIDP